MPPAAAPTIAPDDFAFLAKLVESKAGIVLEAGKEYLVDARLIPLARELGLGTVAGLVKALREKPLSGVDRKVVDAMTTNETSFFRDLYPFEAMKKTILPELIAKRAAARQLNIWCAAASTGQEPVSFCLMLKESFPQLAGWRVNFVATDINAEVLARARAGKYSQLEVNRGMPITMLVKYFTKQGLDWQLRDDVRQMVDYRELNLLGPWPAMGQMDLVLIRNVLIYFQRETKVQILRKIRGLLRPDGYLFLGGAETTLNVDDAFERVALDKTGCYRQRAAVAARALAA